MLASSVPDLMLSYRPAGDQFQEQLCLKCDLLDGGW